MLLKKTLPLAALIAVTGFALNTWAATATATFEVKITITKSCNVVAGTASDIDFGTFDATATNLAANNNISVTCSKKTPYYIGLTPSNNNTVGAGVMTSTTITPSDTVAYQLRSTAGLAGAAWGNTATATAVGNGVAGTGNGAAQTIPVYATVASANSTPDVYLDTVTVTVNY